MPEDSVNKIQNLLKKGMIHLSIIVVIFVTQHLKIHSLGIGLGLHTLKNALRY